ncbi:FusB/FusC family EF-G-binding protein [Lederbergia graminis]|uniref:FusB/FusC family EF-G-binding protein n=1 Tax=Lederbergia graminis TaxID=735518 RepID=A0ABW0LGV6_9BACI
MTTTFIKNEQLNFINKQINLIKDSRKRNVPAHILSAVCDLAQAKILELFPNLTTEQQQLLDVSGLQTDADFEVYLERLSAFIIPFSAITGQQLKKLFPKNKKLKVPDIATMDLHHLTYLSWDDVRSSKKIIVYELEGKLVGIECNLTPSSKKNICSFCNTVGNVSYFSTVTKAKRSNNPDYYKSIGNLICTDSNECNKKITDVTYLEAFLKESLDIK